MMDVPVLTPLITPVVNPADATPPLLLYHMPPEMEFVSVSD